MDQTDVLLISLNVLCLFGICCWSLFTKPWGFWSCLWNFISTIFPTKKQKGYLNYLRHPISIFTLFKKPRGFWDCIWDAMSTIFPLKKQKGFLDYLRHPISVFTLFEKKKGFWDYIHEAICTLNPLKFRPEDVWISNLFQQTTSIPTCLCSVHVLTKTITICLVLATAYIIYNLDMIMPRLQPFLKMCQIILRVVGGNLLNTLRETEEICRGVKQTKKSNAVTQTVQKEQTKPHWNKAATWKNESSGSSQYNTTDSDSSSPLCFDQIQRKHEPLVKGEGQKVQSCFEASPSRRQMPRSKHMDRLIKFFDEAEEREQQYKKYSHQRMGIPRH